MLCSSRCSSKILKLLLKKLPAIYRRVEDPFAERVLPTKVAFIPLQARRAFTLLLFCVYSTWLSLEVSLRTSHQQTYGNDYPIHPFMTFLTNVEKNKGVDTQGFAPLVKQLSDFALT